MAESRFVYRFERDLRLDDHAGLHKAASRGAVVPVLAVDPPLESRLRRSPRRAAFFCAAVAALDRELRERGSRLIVRRGPAAAVLRAVAGESAATGVAWSAAYGAGAIESSERLQSALEEAGYEACAVHDAPAIPPDETAAAHSGAGEGYRAFAPFLRGMAGTAGRFARAPAAVTFRRRRSLERSRCRRRPNSAPRRRR